MTAITIQPKKTVLIPIGMPTMEPQIMSPNPIEYGGKEQVIVGNKDKLKIVSIGHSTLITRNYMLSLYNVLYVPSIAKNLVIMSKLAKDNHIFVEFHD